MQEIITQILSYVWGVWRYRWLALIIAWLIALAGWAYVSTIPDSYVASARVFVDTNTLLRPLLKGMTVQPNLSQRIEMLSRTLMSRPNMEKVMRMTDLDLNVQNDAQKDAMVGRLRSNINLRAEDRRSSLYSITVKNGDRDTAKSVTQALITVFIESSLSDKRESSSGAQTFLDQQIADYEGRLIDAEQRLADFKARNAGVLPGTGGTYYSRLEQARAELREAQLQLSETENRQAELRRQAEGETPVYVTGLPIDGRIDELNKQLDSLLARYTEKHPEVRQIRAMITELESQKQLDVESAVNSDLGAGTSSPVYQGIRSMLAETDADVVELRVRVNEYNRRVIDLEQMVNSIPQIEAELKQLDRDYSVIASQHKQLLKRRESARLSEDVEQNTSDVTFRVIDPPFVPIKPSQPNKLLLNAGVLVVALGAGVAVALLLSLLNQVVVDQQSLARLSGMPLLGTVTLGVTPAQQRRDTRRLFAFSVATLFLFAIFAGLNFMPDLVV